MPVILTPLCFLLSSWGETAHKKINSHAPPSLPDNMAFLRTSWTILLAAHALDADDRKGSDPSEVPKHFINLDAYPEYLTCGYIPQDYGEAVASHGSGFVLVNGTLPWAILTAFDSLRDCFHRGNWDHASSFAADLGHYIADAHQPLHLTLNYDGQLTNQEGIHSRYETAMVNKFDSLIVYPSDAAVYLPDVTQAVFDDIYNGYIYCDSVLKADHQAHEESGGTYGNAYLNHLWNHSGNFTIERYCDASFILASLIFTAWTDAGGPVPGFHELEGISAPELTITCYPDPFASSIKINLEILKERIPIIIEIFDLYGQEITLIENRSLAKGKYEYTWDTRDQSKGIYFLVLKSGNNAIIRKLMIIR